MKILVVDDNRVMRMVICRTLRRIGHEAEQREAASGPDALALLETWTPDLILADWNMPRMTGLELLEEIRRRGYWMPLGFVTSERADELQQRAAEAGASFFLSKPFGAEDLRAAIDGIRSAAA